ncbi:MAG: sn-glycerol-3-phosphate ABC transporter ATP-binding protein UgpC [Comamonadaceae bacterium]
MTPPVHGLQLQGVSKRFGSVSVVQQLDLTVEQGEFVVLLGESGCGKSTVLRMIAGLEDVSEGHIFINGKDVTDRAPMARDIAMVFQNYALYPHMDVAQNMSFALDLAGKPRAEIEKRVNEAAEILSIRHLLKRKPKELSGGQRQRVAIGRCIVREPAVFLFDEPLSNLDAKLRGHMRTELAMLHERLGKTTIYVTHDQVEAMTLASRIVIFHKGHIQQVGTPAEVFNRPANLFVAAFIGMPSMNLLEGTLTPQGEQMLLCGAGFSIPLPVAGPWPAQLAAGVRPQALRLASGPGLLQLQVDVVEYLGTESVLVGKLAGGSEDRVTAVVGGHRIDLLHQTVELEFDASELHTFDKSTGLRVHV